MDEITSMAVLESRPASLKRRRTPAPHPPPTVVVAPPAHSPRSPSWGSVCVPLRHSPVLIGAHGGSQCL